MRQQVAALLFQSCLAIILAKKSTLLASYQLPVEVRNKVCAFFFQKVMVSLATPEQPNMETCVLIPQEFSLAINAITNNNETDLTVWTCSDIAKGQLFYPFQGTIRIDKLNIGNNLQDDDGQRDTRISFLNYIFLFNFGIKLIVFDVKLTVLLDI
uniref:Uncharacterized protein n=1 Tax=Glossina brevipalpis TaxID=37001 RepID=A0A1A9WEV2_9MUSC